MGLLRKIIVYSILILVVSGIVALYKIFQAPFDIDFSVPENSLRQEFAKSNLSIAFSFGREIELAPGKPERELMGYKSDFSRNQSSDANSVCFAIQFFCLQKIGAEEQGCGLLDVKKNSTIQEPILIAGKALDEKIPEASSWDTKMLQFWDVPSPGIDINFVTFLVPPEVRQGRYLIEARVLAEKKEDKYVNCTQVFQNTTPNMQNPIITATKQFTIVVA